MEQLHVFRRCRETAEVRARNHDLAVRKFITCGDVDAVADHIW
jgi:hypothetical protein